MEDKSIKKSILRHGLKEIDRKWAPVLKKGKEMSGSLRQGMSERKKDMAQKMTHTSTGQRYLNKSEQKEKMKDWPKAGSAKMVDKDSSERDKAHYQLKHHRAWND